MNNFFGGYDTGFNTQYSTGYNSYLKNVPTSSPLSNFTQNYNTPVLPTIPGKRINTEKDIAAGEVPSDGSIGLYLCNDLSCIYAKAWNNNGSIDTVRFVREEPVPKASPVEDLEQRMNARFDKIEAMLTTKAKGGSKNGKSANGSSDEVD